MSGSVQFGTLAIPTWLLVTLGLAGLLLLSSTRLAPVAYVILGLAVLVRIMKLGGFTA
ncbi:MAG TPA: hypothetical protein VMW47_11195 [Verrucomicrobiae bacterium]|nr:hypothetical protein [Verrucomicrobiae bacterium]